MNEQPTAAKESRNYGIDLLRLFAMFLVVVLHVINQGGVLAASTGAKHYTVWFFECLSYCAVDVFAMISGFVSYREEKKPYRYSKYLSFWLPVWFYSFFIVLVASFFSPETTGGGNGLLFAALPVTTGRYWYVCAYTGLFFLIPLINTALRHTDGKALGRVIALLFVVFSVYSTVASSYYDVFSFVSGYSMIWLIFMYIAGAYIKKCDTVSRISTPKALLLLVTSVLFTFAASLLSPSLSNLLVTYKSPSVLLCGVSLLLLFAKIKPGRRFSKVIAFLAPAAFGVYIIHTNPWIWDHVFSAAFTWVAYLPVYALPFGLLGAALAVFAGCLAVERFRIFLFKITRLDRLIEFIMQKIDTFFAPEKEV